MKCLMIFASEADILAVVINDEIIDSFAAYSDQLKRQLLFIKDVYPTVQSDDTKTVLHLTQHFNKSLLIRTAIYLLLTV